MNTETIIEKFGAQEIAFDLFQGGLMVNATEMARPFGKRPENFTRLGSTKRLIKALKEDLEREIYPLTSEGIDERISYTKRGFHAGTFMCEDLALAFAMWLSPEFNVWVLKTIRKIIFGNNPALVREAVYNLPKLFEQAKPLRKKLSRLKSKELSKEFRTQFGKLVEEKRNVELKITQLGFHHLFGMLTILKERKHLPSTVPNISDTKKGVQTSLQWIFMILIVGKKSQNIVPFGDSVLKINKNPGLFGRGFFFYLLESFFD